MDSTFRIGYVTANIAGDSRYTTQLEVMVDVDEKGPKQAHIVVSETGAKGGMDGPGGRTNFIERSRKTVPATPAEIVKAIKHSIADERDKVISTYGRPTKRFEWIGVKGSGINAQLCKEALNLLR